eukprot:GHVT01001167.1.p1 GENE.GHVT01001167.1~~GHVT01001167.1.p1  ORF type:complete len:105 (-),score=8.16 GHVT01001167.1:45-359(-)
MSMQELYDIFVGDSFRDALVPQDLTKVFYRPSSASTAELSATVSGSLELAVFFPAASRSMEVDVSIGSSVGFLAGTALGVGALVLVEGTASEGQLSLILRSAVC